MTELTETPDLGEAKSTTLDANAPALPSGGGTPQTLEAKDSPSLRDTIADEMKKDSEAKEKPADDTDAAKGTDGDKDGKATDEKTDKKGKDKPEVPDKDRESDKPDDVKPDDKPKPDRSDDGKFKAKSDSANDADGDDRPGHYQPPAKFLPDAREKWLNVPRAVQRDIDNMAREHEAEVSQLREATQRYESLRQFDELAHSNGRDLTESLTRINEIENLMQSNPYAGLNAILQEIGPRKPDGSPVSLYEVSAYIAQQGPEKWQQMVATRPVNDQPQEDPRVAQLQQQVEQLKAQQTTAAIIEPFKAQHPRYDELKGPIAKILESGMVPASLSPSDRLAAAYDMAERLNPPSNVTEPAPTTSPDADGRADPDLSGTKSIKSAPGSVSPDLAPERGGSIRDLLSDEMKRQRRA